MSLNINLLNIFFLLEFYMSIQCPVQSIQQHYTDAEFIFLGKVLEINADAVEFKVERYWKAGRDSNLVRLKLQQKTRDLEFKPEQEYLVYVRGGKKGNTTSYCDGTKLKINATLDLIYLNDQN